MSPRTADYVATLIREGDNFDYCKWLQRVREKKAQIESSLLASNSGDIIASGQAGNLFSTPGCEDGRLSLGPASTIKPVPVAKTIFRSLRRDAGDPKIRIRRRLEKVRDAWDEFQASRVRDAVYGYLEAVFGIVVHYKVRRKISKLLSHASKFADFRFNKNADPFTAIIRCTSHDSVDSKMISKWARALRYVARCKKATTSLKRFMKRDGGINACANLYARYFGRGRQGYAH